MLLFSFIKLWLIELIKKWSLISPTYIISSLHNGTGPDPHRLISYIIHTLCVRDECPSTRIGLRELSALIATQQHTRCGWCLSSNASELLFGMDYKYIASGFNAAQVIHPGLRPLKCSSLPEGGLLVLSRTPKGISGLWRRWKAIKNFLSR